MKHIFIINPTAGKHDSRQRIYDMADMLRQKHGLEVQCILTKKQGHATEIAKRLCESGEALRFYACGGDGTVNEIAEACRAMSADKTGALIVFPRKDSLDFIVETGDIVDAKVTRRLIMNIFFKNSPLHDGAMIISADRIVAARCTLPITGRSDIPAHYGMRHKAAIGISEETDADVVVVSEETGGISFVRGGNIKSINNINELKLLLGAGEGTTEEKRATEGKQ